MAKVLKNGLVLSLSLAMLLSTSFASAEAAVKSNTAVKGNTAAVVKKVDKKALDKLEKIQPQKLEGVVKAVYERDMKVLDKNGKMVIVPIEPFSKMDGFKDLKLAPETEVVLEGFEPAIHKAMIKISEISPTVIPGKDMVIKELKDDDIMFEQAAGTEGPNLVIHKIPADKNFVPGSEPFNIRLDGPEPVKIPLEVKPGDAKGDIILFKTTETDIKSNITQPNPDGKNPIMTVKPLQIFVGDKTPLKVAPDDILKPLEGTLFFANSITANGKTLKLDVMTAPTKIMIKKEDVQIKTSKKVSSK